MFFTWLERRLYRRQFARYMSEEAVEDILKTYPGSEWRAFKLFLARLNPFWTPDRSTLIDLRRQITRALNQHERQGEDAPPPPPEGAGRASQ